MTIDQIVGEALAELPDDDAYRYERKIKKALREELETAWLRGWAARKTWAHFEPTGVEPSDQELMAADYAERVVGGSTRPEVER